MSNQSEDAEIASRIDDHFLHDVRQENDVEEAQELAEQVEKTCDATNALI